MTKPVVCIYKEICVRLKLLLAWHNYVISELCIYYSEIPTVYYIAEVK